MKYPRGLWQRIQNVTLLLAYVATGLAALLLATWLSSQFLGRAISQEKANPPPSTAAAPSVPSNKPELPPGEKPNASGETTSEMKPDSFQLELGEGTNAPAETGGMNEMDMSKT